MRIIPVAAAVAMFVVSCSSFVPKEVRESIKKYEEPLYIMKVDKQAGRKLIAKGQQVKLVIVTGKESVKVYCYPADEDLLKSHRILLLYLFEDDFDSKVFSLKKFEQKLYTVVEVKKQ